MKIQKNYKRTRMAAMGIISILWGLNGFASSNADTVSNTETGSNTAIVSSQEIAPSQENSKNLSYAQKTIQNWERLSGGQAIDPATLPQVPQVGKEVLLPNAFYREHKVDSFPTYLSPETIDKDTLVIFQVEDLLLWAKNTSFEKSSFSPWKGSPRKAVWSYSSSRTWKSGMPPVQYEPIVPSLSAFSVELQEKGIKGLALARGDCFEMRRRKCQKSDANTISDLQKTGYAFKNSWKGVPELQNLSAGIENNVHGRTPYDPKLPPASFQQGVLFHRTFNPGQVLERFLNAQSNWRPKSIISFDVDFWQLDLNTLSKKLQIPCLRINCAAFKEQRAYRGLRGLRRPLSESEIKNMPIQMENFKNTGEFLSDFQVGVRRTSAVKPVQDSSTPQ